MGNVIEVTGIDLVKLAQKVYELSVPQGMGFLHFTPTPLSKEDAKSLIHLESDYPLDMDYVAGRACKFHVRKEGDKLFINSPWYDHTDKQLQELLAAFNIKSTPSGEHGCACNCVECQKKQAAA